MHAIGRKVIILGAGVAGMSAAHELIKRGFEVEVYERNTTAGGKARSVQVASQVGGRPLPGEHGFRFFPAFYRHVTQTMRDIPAQEHGQLVKGKTVFDNLDAAAGVIFDRIGAEPFAVPTGFPQFIRSISNNDQSGLIWKWFSTEVAAAAADPFAEQRGLSNGQTPSEPDYVNIFSERLWQVLTSCERRRTREYERMSWWDFTHANEQSARVYRQYLVQTMTRSLIAANARDANAKVVGDIGIQVLAGMLRPDGGADRVLNGPTSESWITPWQKHLESQGVTFQFNTKLQKLNYSKGKIQSVTLIRVDEHGHEIGQPYAVGQPGDYYIAALPVEVMAALLEGEANAALRDADPQFANIRRLRYNTEWMSGMQFYFKQPLFAPYIRDKALEKSHLVFLDSEWALTAISQPQFWPKHNPRDWGDGTVQDVVSVIISNWETPGLVSDKTAKQSTQQEIENEVLAQIANHLYGTYDDATVQKLRNMFADAPALDPDLLLVQPKNTPDSAVSNSEFDAHSLPGQQDKKKYVDLWENQAQLFINKPSTWQLQPEAATRVANLFLAADYVRTFTQLPTMEAANEAARHAVNSLIKAIVKHDADRVRLATRAAARTPAQADAAALKPAWVLTSRGARRVVGKPTEITFCRIWDLNEPWLFCIWRLYDQLRYRFGLPWRADIPWFLKPVQWAATQYYKLFMQAERPISHLRRPSEKSARPLQKRLAQLATNLLSGRRNRTAREQEQQEVKG